MHIEFKSQLTEEKQKITEEKQKNLSAQQIQILKTDIQLVSDWIAEKQEQLTTLSSQDKKYLLLWAHQTNNLCRILFNRSHPAAIQEAVQAFRNLPDVNGDRPPNFTEIIKDIYILYDVERFLKNIPKRLNINQPEAKTTHDINQLDAKTTHAQRAFQLAYEGLIALLEETPIDNAIDSSEVKQAKAKGTEMLWDITIQAHAFVKVCFDPKHLANEEQQKVARQRFERFLTQLNKDNQNNLQLLGIEKCIDEFLIACYIQYIETHHHSHQQSVISPLSSLMTTILDLGSTTSPKTGNQSLSDFESSEKQQGTGIMDLSPLSENGRLLNGRLLTEHLLVEDKDTHTKSAEENFHDSLNALCEWANQQLQRLTTPNNGQKRSELVLICREAANLKAVLSIKNNNDETLLDRQAVALQSFFNVAAHSSFVDRFAWDWDSAQRIFMIVILAVIFAIIGGCLGAILGALLGGGGITAIPGAIVGAITLAQYGMAIFGTMELVATMGITMSGTVMSSFLASGGCGFFSTPEREEFVDMINDVSTMATRARLQKEALTEALTDPETLGEINIGEDKDEKIITQLPFSSRLKAF